MSKSVRIEASEDSRVITARNTVSADVRAIVLDDDEWKESLQEFGKDIKPSGNLLQQARERMGASPNVSAQGSTLAEAKRSFSFFPGHSRGGRTLSLRAGNFYAQEDEALTSHEGRNYSIMGSEEHLTFAYGQWCERKGEGRDCLNLLTEGSNLNIDGKRSLALELAFGSVWEETKAAFQEMADPDQIRNVVMLSIAMYLALWLAPEPVTKGIAALMTAGIIAYLGVDTAYRLVTGYIVMARNAEAAQTFNQLREAGDEFGRLLGQNAARIFVMLATAAIGTTAGLVAGSSALPGAAAAAASFEAQTTLAYSSIGSVQTVAMTSSGFVIGVSAGATFMSSNEMDPPRPDRLGEEPKVTSAPNSSGLSSDKGGNYTVYLSRNRAGEVHYVGMTNDFARRAAEHMRQKGITIIRVMKGLSKADARSVEQSLIEIHGLKKNGGTLMNEINSTARMNPKYTERLKHGLELLRSIGYTGE